MAKPLPPIISAQVLISGNGSGNRIDRLRREWHEAGFGIGPAVGGTFSIAATPAHFEDVFDVLLFSDGEGGVLANRKRSLPLEPLPRTLREGVTLVTFGRPPSFGPERS